MSNQSTLPLEPPVRRPAARASDPDTSHEAARSISRTATTVSQQVVWAALWQSEDFYHEKLIESLPGFTDEQLVEHAADVGPEYEQAGRIGWPCYGLSPSRLRTARKELVDMGLVEGEGDPVCWHNRPKLAARVIRRSDGERPPLWKYDGEQKNRMCNYCDAHQRKTRSGRWATVWRLSRG